MLIIGSHVSFKKDTQIYGSVKEALSYNSNALMLYTGAPQNTLRYAINDEMTSKAYELMKGQIDINNIIVHAPYIINLANDKNVDFNISFLKQELKRVEKLGITKLVLHPGSHVGLGKELGLNNIVFCLKQVLDTNVTILLETMAIKGTELGTIDDLAYIINEVNSPKIGVCLDTCHLNDAGLNINDFEQFLDTFDKKIGIKKIGCVHINDSKNEIGTHKDRHANIGFGTIGFDELLNVIYNERLKEVPKILETPYVDDYPPYKYEIDMIRKKQFNNNLLEDIKTNHGI